jgi:hypothetical protein
MINQYVKSVRDLQELFHELDSAGKLSDGQATRFDAVQKVLVSFNTWIREQMEGNSKTELPWTDQRFADAWKLWTDFKKQQFQFTYKPISEQGALKDLADLSEGNMELAIAIIHQSIKKGWRGLFRLKEENTITKNLVSPQGLDYKKKLFERLTKQQ